MNNSSSEQAHIAVQAAIIENIHASKHAIKLIANLVIAVIKLRTANLAQLANALESEALPESRYKQVQRFLRSFRWRESGFESVMLGFLEITGKVDIALDRTEWKFGTRWINILTVALVYRGFAVPVGWKVFSHKGNVSARRHVLVLSYVVNRIGANRIGKVFADREFASGEMFEYLSQSGLDFCLRLKKSHLADGVSLKELAARASRRVRYKGRRSVRVFGFLVGISCVRVSESEYLILATRSVESNAIEEYRKRWQIETLFGCLKSRGFDLETTHLTKRTRVERLFLVLGLALTVAIKTGEIRAGCKKVVQKITVGWQRGCFELGWTGCRTCC